MTTYVDSESRKRSHTEDSAPVMATRAGVMPHGPSEEKPDPAARAVRSRSEYPDIKYWTRDEWTVTESRKKESTDPTDSKTGQKGRTRCAQGENVSATFIEDTDGELIGGKEVSDIRAHARSLWKDFYARGIAPKKWSDAPRSLIDEYSRDMEEHWPVLQYCANHWKANHIATLAYSQWYKYYHRKISANQVTEQKGPAQKKLKKTVDSDDNDIQMDPETDTTHDSDASDEDRSTTLPSQLDKDIREGPTRDTSRPRARPLRLGDPL